MKHLHSVLALMTIALFLTACGSSDPHEAAVEDMIDIMGDIESALSQVEDVESAKGLSSDFEKIGKKLNEAIKSMADLGALTDEQEEALKKKIEPQLEAIKEKMQEQMKRIGKLDPQVMMAMLAEMAKIEPTEKMPEWIDKVLGEGTF